MPFQTPTLPEIIDRTAADMQSRAVGGSGSVLRRSLLGVLARVLAGASHLLHKHLEYNSRQLIPDTADSLNLERWAAVWGLTRNPATFAGGTITFTGVDSSAVPAGTAVQASNGEQYTTDAAGTIAGGSVTVAATAVNAGAVGNIEVGVAVSLVSPVAGIDSEAVVAGGFADGGDQEADADLRARLLDRIQYPPRGGSANDYKVWAEEVAGVTRAFVYPLRGGPGRVGITFVMDDADPIIPDNTKVQEVQDYIDARRPVTANVDVFAPVAVPLDITIKLDPNTAEVQAAVTAEIEDFILRKSVPESFIYESQLREAISIAAGEVNHEIVSTSPAISGGKITAGYQELLTAGTITFQSF